MRAAGSFVRSRTFWKRLLIALIVLYPLIGAFLGLDLGDTGNHLYAYTNLAEHPEKVNYTVFFSSVIGFAWGRLFGFLGLLAYNLLEVFLEWGVAFMVYRTFRRDLGELTVLAGCLFAVVAADTYLNIFNYHQLTMLLLTAILCLQFRAMTDDRKAFSFWAGVCYTLAVFARMPSVVMIVTCCLYVYHAAMHAFPWKSVRGHLLMFAAGAAAMCALVAGGMLATGYMSAFVSDIFRLGGIASDQSSSYGMGNMVEYLVKDNLKVLASGFLFYAAAGVLAYGVNLMLKKCETVMQRLLTVLVGFFFSAVAVYLMYHSYHLNPAPSWPQMTTGQQFLLGVLYVTAFIGFVYYGMKKDTHSRRIALLIIMACAEINLMIAGSNTRTKHIVLALWLMAPVCIYILRQVICTGRTALYAGKVSARLGFAMHPKTLRVVAVVALTMFFLKYAHMVYYSFNYDAVDRTKLTATVNNPKVRGILTTKREADAVNSVLETLEGYDEEQPLMVVGYSLLFYYLTDREAYVKPWVTQGTYPLENLQEDLQKRLDENEDELPLVVYCRTNNAYGFEEKDLDRLQREMMASSLNGKKQVLFNFLKAHNYGITYIDDYYAVLVPNLTTKMINLRRIMLGV